MITFGINNNQNKFSTKNEIIMQFRKEMRMYKCQHDDWVGCGIIVKLGGTLSWFTEETLWVQSHVQHGKRPREWGPLKSIYYGSLKQNDTGDLFN